MPGSIWAVYHQGGVNNGENRYDQRYAIGDIVEAKIRGPGDEPYTANRFARISFWRRAFNTSLLWTTLL